MRPFLADLLAAPWPIQLAAVLFVALAGYGLGTLTGQVRGWVRYRLVTRAKHDAIRELTRERLARIVRRM